VLDAPNCISCVKEVVRVLVLKKKEWLLLQKNNQQFIKYLKKRESMIFAFYFKSTLTTNTNF
jgi:hypothetical protein